MLLSLLLGTLLGIALGMAALMVIAAMSYDADIEDEEVDG